MTVYVDVLIVVNIFINFILLLLTARFNAQEYKTVRLLLGASVGGICSLVILLPISNAFINILIKLLTAIIMILFSFSFVKIKIFLRNVFILFALTYIFAGIMLSIWYLFKPNKILVNNSTVYFDISVTYLILLTAIIYLIITITNSLLKKEALNAKKCKIRLTLQENTITLNGIIDTGNSLKDLFGDRETVTVSEKEIIKICNGKKIIEKYPERYRILPCKSVTGESLLEGIRCDNMEIELEGKRFNFKNPVAVISKSDFSDNFNAILNSEILTKMR